MRTQLFCLVAVALAAPAYTQTTAPDVPSVTTGAEFKGLRFDWDPVPGAAWYQFEHRPHQSGGYVQQGADLPASATNVRFRLPLHLFDWTHARYRVAACNGAGCTRSGEVSVSNLRRDAVGYFKASPSLTGIRFGEDTDISPDGSNFVAAAPGDFISSGNSARAGGAIYVFRRQSNGTWVQRARLTPTIPPFIEGLNAMRVAISADGNTVVLGMPNYFHERLDEQSGEVFVFRFNGTSWIRTRLASGDRGRFGRWVAINDAGDTIATPYGEQDFDDRPHRVAIYKLLNGAWQPVRGIADRAGHREFCGDGVLSRDGSTVAETCTEQPPGTPEDRTYVRTHSGANWTVREDIELEIPGEGEPLLSTSLAIDGTGNTIAAQMRQFPNFEFLGGLAEVQVFTRSGGSYAKAATFKPGSWRNPEDRALFGSGLAVSADGGTIAVGDVRDNGFGTGPRAAPLNPDTRALGGVYVYRLRGSWVLANMVKPNFRSPLSESFGRELALNGNGQTLIVGNGEESSSAEGIGGDWANRDGDGAASGAVFMY